MHDLWILVRNLTILGIFGWLVISNPIVSGVIGGVMWAWNADRESVNIWQEANFERVCPEYKAASTWDRWMDSNLGLIDWCDDYIDRL